jgi:hypothetical protein
LKCPVCKLQFAVKARGPVPKTCSDRCEHALALWRAYQRGKNEASTFLKKDITALAFLSQRRRRHQAIIDDMLTDIDEGRCG